MKHNCYANCHVELAVEIAISLPALFLFKGHGVLFQTRQLGIPSFAFSSLRACAF